MSPACRAAASRISRSAFCRAGGAAKVTTERSAPPMRCTMSPTAFGTEASAMFTAGSSELSSGGRAERAM